MTRLALLLSVPLAGCLSPSPELALRDVDGVQRTPLRGNEKQPTVLFFITHDCPVANKFAPEIRRITRDFAGQARFTLVYVDPDLSVKDLQQHREDFSYLQLIAVHDRQHQLVAATGAEVTPEAVVIHPTGQVVYRGRINNFYEAFGQPRRVITQHDLRAALTALLAGQPVPAPRGQAIGCFIPRLK